MTKKKDRKFLIKKKKTKNTRGSQPTEKGLTKFLDTESFSLKL